MHVCIDLFTKDTYYFARRATIVRHGEDVANVLPERRAYCIATSATADH